MKRNNKEFYLENYIDTGLLCLELDLSDIMFVRCYVLDDDLYSVDLEFSTLDDMNEMSILLTREKALELYYYILENARNLVGYESAF